MISIHLMLKDSEYQRALARRLIDLNPLKQIYSHQPEEKIISAEAGLWLISPEYQEFWPAEAQNVLWLGESPSEEEDKCFLYQPVEKIERQIMARLYQLGLVESQGSPKELIYLYSPFGGIGVSQLAYQLAQKLAGRERVLLLSLDAYHNFTEEFIPFRLSDFLFYWQTLGKANISDFCLTVGGFEIMHGPSLPGDLEILRQSRKEDFLKCLGDYDKIIIDLSSSHLLDWFAPSGDNEKLFVLKREESKWKRFMANCGWEYLALERKEAVSEILSQLRR